MNQPVPSGNEFPHRALPPSKTFATKKRTDLKGKGRAGVSSDEEEEEQEPENENEDGLNGTNGQASRGSQLRMQHFRVLVAILHKCLLEGDIKRAMRAWTMLLRTQFAGQMVDIRSTGYWAIGVELLARSEDTSQPLTEDPEDEENADYEGNEREKGVDMENLPGGEREWGTRAGRAKAVGYLERLSLHFPFRRQHTRVISAVDFWPSMLAIEIYGIQYEQRQALRRITAMTEQEASEDESDGSEEDEDSGQIQGDESYAVAERRMARRKHKKEVKYWKKRDEIRITTLTAIQSITARVDELFTDPLYKGNITILEIRAHIAIFVGDLSVPEKYPELEDEDEEDEQESSQSRKRPMDTEKRMFYRQRANEYEAGKRTREEEIRRATTIVKKILKHGGNVDDFRALNLERSIDD